MQQDSGLTFSVGLYRLLLLAYPATFRQEYGPQMLQVFRDRARQRSLESGTGGILIWWGVTLIDFIGSVVQQHLRKETYMTVPGYVRAAGWALVFSGIALIGFWVAMTQLRDGSNPQAWLMGTGMLLLATLLAWAGTMVIRDRFAQAVGPVGRGVLVGGLLGALFILTAFSNVWDLDLPWSMLPFLGPALLQLSLAVFGLIALRRRFLPPSLAWNLVAGFWFALLLVGITVADASGVSVSWETATGLGLLGGALMSIGLVRLGFILINPPTNLPVAA